MKSLKASNKSIRRFILKQKFIGKFLRKAKKIYLVTNVRMKGYSKNMGLVWYSRKSGDYKKYSSYRRETMEKIHKKGYLAKSIKKYDLLNNNNCEFITDFDYIYLSPHNNSFSKWVDDIITSQRILFNYKDHFRKTYFSIITRDNKHLILKVGEENREYTCKDIIELLKEKQVLELRPAFWNSKRSRYVLRYEDNVFYINDRVFSYNRLYKIIKRLRSSYVVIDHINVDHYIKLYIANDVSDQPEILDSYMTMLWDDCEKKGRHKESLPIDIKNGDYYWRDSLNTVDNWQKVLSDIKDISMSLSQLSFFSISIYVEDGGDFKILNFNTSPYLPEIKMSKELNEYLKNKFQNKRQNYHKTKSFKVKLTSTRKLIVEKFLMKFARPGIRPYMQKLWVKAIIDDFKHSDKSLKEKYWCWSKGFYSWRIHQYGLNNSNYKNFLSDYDYHWLNRINNSYQKWINDKTTFRYIMEPFKQYLPEYYFSISKRNGEVLISKMPDCPDKYTNDVDGLFGILEDKKKLAVKASAGTHGDGFYCMIYDNNKYYVNDQEMSRDEIVELIKNLKSFYLVTEFINMNDELKKIYSKSVNSIRVMVINKKGYNPKIMQTYMRIGSSTTGYTDNIGYGGVCVYVDIESGEMYQPEIIVNHFFEPCEVHKDTGVRIEGVIPHWQQIKAKIVEVCQYMPEIEYLGFDIAVTNDSFIIIEINIHQDLHKVADFTEEINDFFREKINLKKINNIR